MTVTQAPRNPAAPDVLLADVVRAERRPVMATWRRLEPAVDGPWKCEQVTCSNGKLWSQRKALWEGPAAPCVPRAEWRTHYCATCKREAMALIVAITEPG